MAQWHRHVYLFMSLCYVGRHSYFCNANMPILFPICQYNDINIIAEHCICQLPLSETLVMDERKIGSLDIVFVFVKQLTCHSSRRLRQTVPCPPRVRSWEGLARVLYQPQPRVQTGLAEVVAAYHRKLHSDLEETKRAAISASELPLSLIIVGVGRRLREYERSG